MSDCNCGTTGLGSYFGRVGGQFGDRLTHTGLGYADMAAKRFKSWTGLGDYQIVSNSLISSSGDLQAPVTATGGRGIRIRFREYLGDISTASSGVGDFAIQSWKINPANIHTFPWLAPIAQQFDQYKPLGVIFEFRSTATEYSGTSASLGSVIMATDYDVFDTPFTSKSQMLNNAYSQEAKMSDSTVHGIECDPRELQRSIFYTRPTTTLATVQSRDYDVGNFYVATQGGGLPAGQIIGSLYVHYEFEFFKEQIWGGIPAKNQIAMRLSKSSTSSTPAMAALYPSISGVAPTDVVRSGVDLGITSIPALDFTLFIPQKWAGAYFKVTMSTMGDPVGATRPDSITTDGCEFLRPSNQQMLGGVTSNYLSAKCDTLLPLGGPFTSQEVSIVFFVKIDDNPQSNASFTINEPYGNAPTGVTNYSMLWELISEEKTFYLPS